MGIIFTGTKSYLFESFTNEFVEEISTVREDQLFLIGFKSPTVASDNSAELFRNNVQRLRQTLESYEQVHFSKIIFLSAISVYGQSWDGSSNVASPSPNDFYSLAKLHCEQSVIKYARRIGAAYYILRVPGIVGPKSKRNFISNLRDSIFLSKEIEVSAFSNRFNNLITTVGVEKIFRVIIHNKIKSGIYNLASRRPIPIGSIIQTIEEFYSKKIFCRVNISIRERIISTALIENIFGFNESVEDAIRYALEDSTPFTKGQT